MTRYLISQQQAASSGAWPHLVWRAEFIPLGQLTAFSAEAALREARALGWHAPVVSPLADESAIPQLLRRPAPRKVLA